MLRTARPLRLAASAVAFTSVALLLLVAAGAAQAAVWVIPATGRAFPGTPPGASQTISIDAARNEYEGAQVVLRDGGDHAVSFSWSADSDPLIVTNTILDQVYYVNVTQPTTDLRRRAGPYPDPLVPRSFDSQIAVPGFTTSFYLLTHVPLDTPGGDYGATLIVQNGLETVQVPFSLHVWGFGWAQLSTRTGFGLDQKALRRSVEGSGLRWNNRAQRNRLLLNTYVMLAQHGISPLGPLGLPQPSADGTFDASKYASELAPYLGAGGLDLAATRIPWLRWWPWSFDRAYDASSPQLATYLTELCALYQQYGWQSRPTPTSWTRPRNAARSGRRSATPAYSTPPRAFCGYRLKFLLTDDPRPRPRRRQAARQQLPQRRRRHLGRALLLLLRAHPGPAPAEGGGQGGLVVPLRQRWVARLPNFVIEKSNTDQRVWGWLMDRWNVDGLINWALNHWSMPDSPSIYRDPYQDPLSRHTSDPPANGDSSIIYPGYYPAYGLNDPYAAPVSSLRLEALRDGLEDREYMRIADGLPGGAQAVRQALATITRFPYKAVQKNVFNFPTYTRDPAAYEAARYAVADFIAAYQQ